MNKENKEKLVKIISICNVNFIEICKLVWYCLLISMYFVIIPVKYMLFVLTNPIVKYINNKKETMEAIEKLSQDEDWNTRKTIALGCSKKILLTMVDDEEWQVRNVIAKRLVKNKFNFFNHKA